MLTVTGEIDMSNAACLFAHARRLDITVSDTLATVLAISGLSELAAVRVAGPAAGPAEQDEPGPAGPGPAG